MASWTLEAVTQQNRQLRDKIDQLETENTVLKRSLFDLSLWKSGGQHGGGPQPFDLDQDGGKWAQDPRMATKADAADIARARCGFGLVWFWFWFGLVWLFV
jgi:hypothetical protein